MSKMPHMKVCFYLTFMFKLENSESGLAESHLAASDGLLFDKVIEDERKRIIEELRKSSGLNVEGCFLVNCTQTIMNEEE